MDKVDEENAMLWTPYSIPDLPIWHKERICVIGHAAPALPPNREGTAMAFEDAAVLARLLASGQALEQGYARLFIRFEQCERCGSS